MIKEPVPMIHRFAALFFFLVSVVWIDSAIALNTVTVEFTYKGKPYLVKGVKTGKFSYVFNKGAQKKISITTLEWAPYIGKDICGQGWVQQVTIALLASQGYEITSTFYPWARTISLAERGEVDVLYPEYYIEKTAPSDVYKGTRRVDHLALSDKFPGGTIAFMKRTGENDRFNGNLMNLKNESIGVVRGYQNTPEFDAMMDAGFFKISEATDDLLNAKKLVGKRVNLIIGDPTAIRYAVSSSGLGVQTRARLLRGLEVVKPYIQYNHLYYAVSKKKPFWKSRVEMLNRALKEFEQSGELFRIIRDTNEACGYEMETLHGIHP